MIERVLEIFLAILLSLLCAGMMVVMVGAVILGEWATVGIMAFISTSILYCTVIIWKLIAEGPDYSRR